MRLEDRGARNDWASWKIRRQVNRKKTRSRKNPGWQAQQRDQHQTAHGIKGKNIDVRDQHQVQYPEDRQDQESSQQETVRAGTPEARAFRLYGHADTEREREQAEG